MYVITKFYSRFEIMFVQVHVHVPVGLLNFICLLLGL